MTTVFLATGPAGLARAELAEGCVQHVAAGYDVRCVAADPHAAQNAYAGTQGDGVLRSDDAGRTWHRSGLEGRVVKTLVISALIHGRLTPAQSRRGEFKHRSQLGRKSSSNEATTQLARNGVLDYIAEDREAPPT
jgi:hypothetical protein